MCAHAYSCAHVHLHMYLHVLLCTRCYSAAYTECSSWSCIIKRSNSRSAGEGAAKRRSQSVNLLQFFGPCHGNRLASQSLSGLCQINQLPGSK